MIKHYKITVTGSVQGVGFRYSVRNIAHNLGISGFVKNLYDGSVYIEAEAEQNILAQFVDWCKQGPKMAIVEHVDIKEAELNGFLLFEVRY
ncbi:MAG: acylphosphatase [Bacteroidia bacterium]|nr:acylphosphatase [Bacteroidia bacterium]